MPPMKVLVTDMRHATLAEERKVLEPLGVSLDSTFCAGEEELIANGRGAVGFLVSYAPVTRRVLESLPELRIVVKYGIGVDNIDVEAARELGKVVANVPEYSTEEVALHALTLALCGLRMIFPFARAVKEGMWHQDPSGEGLRRPSALTVGVVGLGRIGRRFARYAEPIASNICWYDPYLQGEAPYRRLDTVEELVERSQVVSVHAPLNERTRSLLGRRALAGANGLVLVNTSRGGVVDRDALEGALEAGRVVFFGADVFWSEPPDYDDPRTVAFLRRRNVLITPHMAWCSLEADGEVRRKAAEEVARVIRGQQPLHPL